MAVPAIAMVVARIYRCYRRRSCGCYRWTRPDTLPQALFDVLQQRPLYGLLYGRHKVVITRRLPARLFPVSRKRKYCDTTTCQVTSQIDQPKQCVVA